MSWFEDSNIKKSYIVQTVSDVGIFSACTQIYLTNILPCAGDTINITGNLGVSGNISGTTYYGDGSQLSGIVTTDNYVTGGVYSASTETLYFTGTTGFTPFSVDVSALLDDTNSYVTGGTYNPTTDTVTLTRNDDVNISITGISDTFTTGGTYNESTELITFIKNDGSSYTVDLAAIVSGTTNSYTTGATLNGNIIEFANSVLGLNYYNVDLTPIVSGKVETSLFNTYTGDTETTLNSKLDTTTFNTYSGNVETQLSNKTDNTNFTSHTGDTTIHFTKGSINLSDLGSSAHTHPISEVINLQTELDGKVETSLFNTYTGDTETELNGKTDNTNFNSHTGDTTIHYTKSSINLSDLGSSAHTHTLSEITDFNSYSGSVQTQIDGKVETTLFNTYTGNTQTTLNTKIESASNVGGANNVFSGKSGTDLQFRTISGGSNTTITTVGGIIKIDSTGGGSTTPTLQEVLSSGNTTSGNDIIMTEGDDVVFKYSGWNNRINTQPLTTHRGINFPDNDGTVALVSDTTGYTETTLFNTYTGDTETALNSKTNNTDFTSHTGDTTIHYTKGSINLSDLGSSAHTHSISEVVNLQTELDSKTNTSLFNTHTGDTNNPHQTSFSNLTSTAHTHSISDVVNLQTELDNKLATTTFNSYTGSVVDVFVYSGNANVATQQLSFTNTTGGTFNVTNAAALFSDNDINVTGGTYNPTTGCVTFTTNSGTTFDVCGFITGLTDTFVSGGTYNPSTDIITLTRNDAVTIDITGVTDNFVVAGSYSDSTDTISLLRQDGSFVNVTGVTDTFVTGFTYNDVNTFTISRNDGVDLTSTINTVTGLTVNGNIDVIGDINVTGTTFYTNITGTSIGVDYIDFNNNLSPLPTNLEGRIYWDEDNGTLSLGLHGGQVTQQIGLEQYYYVKNQSGATIENGRVVRSAGTLGASGRILGEYMIADGTIPPKFTLGIATEDIVNGDDGYVTEFGLVRGVNTTGSLYGESWTGGTILWASPTIPGGLTSVEPQAPNLKIEMAIVINAASNGSMFVRPNRYPYLYDLQQINYSAGTENNLDILQWNSSNLTWDKTNTPSFNSVSATTISGGSLTINGDTTLGPLTASSITSNSAINVFNGHINLRDNSYFLQGRTGADANVSLIGVDSQDKVLIGNAGYDTYIDSDTIVDGSLSATTLNINTIGGTTSVTNLGIDSNGNVVSGTTGESNTASNVGGGTGLFAQKSVADLEFKSLTSTGGTVTISSNATTVNLESTGGGTSYWEETASAIKLDTAATTRDIVEINTGAAVTYGGSYSQGNLVVGDGHTFGGSSNTVRRSFIGGSTCIVGTTDSYEKSIGFGQTLIIQGDEDAVFGAGNTVVGNRNFTANNGVNIYGTSNANLGPLNNIGTVSTANNNTVTIGQSLTASGDDQILIGKSFSTSVSTVKGIYIGLDGGRASAGFFQDALLGTGMNFAIGGDQTMRSLGVIQNGSGKGIFYLNNYTGNTISEPTVDIGDSVAMWAKKRSDDVVGLLVKDESGEKSWIGGRIGVGIVDPTEALEVSGNTVISGTITVGTVNSGTPVTNLAVDSSGNVVEASTSVSDQNKIFSWFMNVS